MHAGYEEPILQLLLNGAPDKAIAARLRVSERTVQRRVSVLLARSGADNRMQLGQILASRERVGPGGEAPGPRPHRPNAFDAGVLRLLLQGVPESAIAESLAVSRRTVQRCVQGLMVRTGAANRVQLGWQAQLNGWLP